MKIVVCVKRVRTLGDEVEFTDDQRDVDPDFLESSLNEWDSHATEEALALREKLGEAEVVVITVDGPDGEDTLRRCLAMGADRAIRIEPGAGRVADPLTVARSLAGPVRAENPDLVLTGVQSSDSVQAAVGTALAELLDLPRVAVVTKLDCEVAQRRALVSRELEGGVLALTEVDLPAVLTIQTGINKPRYATLRAIKQAAQKELTVIDAEPAATPSSRIRRMYAPPKEEGAQLITGSPEEIADRITEIVREALK